MWVDVICSCLTVSLISSDGRWWWRPKPFHASHISPFWHQSTFDIWPECYQLQYVQLPAKVSFLLHGMPFPAAPGRTHGPEISLALSSRMSVKCLLPPWKRPSSLMCSLHFWAYLSLALGTGWIGLSEFAFISSPLTLRWVESQNLVGSWEYLSCQESPESSAQSFHCWEQQAGAGARKIALPAFTLHLLFFFFFFSSKKAEWGRKQD